MSDDTHLEMIAAQWRQRAPELANWTYQRLVNRTDVWGRYLKPESRKKSAATMNKAVTAPFRDERGKVFLGGTSLEKHFRARDGGGILGLHSVGSDGGSRWLAIDIDLHDEEHLSVTPEGNFAAARTWFQRLQKMGFDPLLLDSNGRGGFHLWILFAAPMASKSVVSFGQKLVADYRTLGLDDLPELFPGKSRPGHYGSWLRIPGLHHTHGHYSRVWNDEPWAEEPWLEGHEAIDRIVSLIPASAKLCRQNELEVLKRTVCVDFDGVIHSYVSGWMGEGNIPDPPIHRVDEAIAKLREDYRVVIYSARCRSSVGRDAIAAWLEKHGIEVDEICEHKPPAFVYIDDRAIPFTGNWDQCMLAIQQFRK